MILFLLMSLEKDILSFNKQGFTNALALKYIEFGPFTASVQHRKMHLLQSLRSEKENALPLSPVTRKPFRPDDSILMPPPTKLPPVTRRRPTSASSKTVHSDSETSESQSTLNASANISGSTPNFETVV